MNKKMHKIQNIDTYGGVGGRGVNNVCKYNVNKVVQDKARLIKKFKKAKKNHERFHKQKITNKTKQKPSTQRDQLNKNKNKEQLQTKAKLEFVKKNINQCKW